MRTCPNPPARHPRPRRTAMTGAACEAHARRPTLTHSDVVYGIEQYLPGHRVRWAFQGDICRDGSWYEEDQEICFVYEDDPTPQCWTFVQTDKGLRARFTGDPQGADLSEVGQSATPLICAGPDVGV